MSDDERDIYPDNDERVQQGHEQGKRDAAAHYRKAIVALYRTLGFEESACSSCKKTVWWARTKKGKAIPLTIDGVAHFADCPNADQHRKRKDKA